MRSFLELVEQTADIASDLITLDDLKLALGITVDTEDEALESYITRQSLLIAEEIGRILGLTGAVETFVFDQYETSRPGATLYLSLWPVADIESVTIDGVATEAYQFERSSGRLRIPNVSWSGTVAVTYTGGWSLPDEAPARLKEAVIQSIQDVRSSAESAERDATISSVTHGDTRVTYFNGQSSASGTFLSSSVIDLIRPYKKPAMA